MNFAAVLAGGQSYQESSFKGRCLRSVSFIGTKGAFVSSLSTTERFHLGRFLELLGQPVKTGE